MGSIVLKSVQTKAEFNESVFDEGTVAECKGNMYYNISVSIDFVTSGNPNMSRKELENHISTLLFNQLQIVEL